MIKLSKLYKVTLLQVREIEADNVKDAIALAYEERGTLISSSEKADRKKDLGNKPVTVSPGQIDIIKGVKVKR